MVFGFGALATTGAAICAEQPSQLHDGATGRIAQAVRCENVESADANASAEALIERAECLLKSGRVGLATLLLQRVVSRQPSNAKALDMLRRAEQSLGLAKDSLVPPVAPVRWSDNFRLGGWLAVQAGKDSNINSATDRTSIEVPLLNFRSLALAPLLVQKQSPFLGVHGGIMGTYSIAPGWEAFLHGAASLRYNSAESAYLPHNYLAAAGITRYLGPVALGAKLGTQEHRIAKYSMLEKQSTAFSAEVQATESLTLRASAEISKNQYPLFSNLHTHGSTWSAGIRDQRTGLAARVETGSERSGDAIRDLDRNFIGTTLTWSHRYERIGRLTIGVSTGTSRYTEFSQLFNTQRRDRTEGYHASLDYPISKEWHVTPRWSQDRNKSNLPLVAFSRHQWMVELRRDF